MDQIERFRQYWYSPEGIESLRKVADVIKTIHSNFFFWIAVATFTIVEPFITTYKPSPSIIATQILVIFINATLFAIDISGELLCKWDSILDKDKTPGRSDAGKFFRHFRKDGKSLLSFVCILNGFVFIWSRPGVAALRCFRMLRLLW